MSDSHVTETVSSSERTRSIAPLLAPGTLIAGRYEVVAARGVGGSAVVYEANDKQLNRPIALKLLRSDRATDIALRRLRREVALTRQLQSPHVVRVFDIGESEHGYFVTMEFVDGETLRTVIERGALPNEDAIRIAAILLEALAALHATGVVHRDVKPSNVLLDGDGNVKLADFGLALQTDADESRATATDAVVGTMEYLAPEQALGKAVDQRSDLYGLGALLFEMVTGRMPFARTSSLAGVIARLNEKSPDARRFNRDVPRWLSRFIARLLERDPGARYGTAFEALTDLRRRRVIRRVRLSSAAAFVLVASVLGWIGHSVASRPHFARFVVEGDGRGHAVAADGRRLWPIFNPGSLATAFHMAGGRPFVAAILGPAHLTPAQRQILTILDADSGKTIDRVVMPNGHWMFSDLANDYGPDGLTAVDLDGDGNDEILIPYVHNPYYPSFIVWFDPASRQSRVIFAASGHHRVVGAADVNGDGRKDVIVTGINNRMGWYAAIAALDVPRDPQGSRARSVPVASSPDTLRSNGLQDTLLWYSLLPIHSPSLDRVTLDNEHRSINIRYSERRTVRVGFDGFVRGSRGTARDRNAARTQAYAALREANRLVAVSRSAEALRATTRAQENARAAGDEILAEWCDRAYATLLIKAGRPAEADSLFARILRASDAASDVAWEAALTYHRRGNLARAIDWYRRGWGEHAEGNSGRPRVEFLQGEVLALGELGRWNDALRTLAGHAYDGVGTDQLPFFENYVRWRTAVPLLPYNAVGPGTTDLLRYWDLEFRLTNGDDPNLLLSAIEREMKERQLLESPLLLSLRAVVLQRVGRHAEAMQSIGRSLQRAEIERESDPAIRAHYDLLKKRLHDIANAKKG